MLPYLQRKKKKKNKIQSIESKFQNTKITNTKMLIFFCQIVIKCQLQTRKLIRDQLADVTKKEVFVESDRKKYKTVVLYWTGDSNSKTSKNKNNSLISLIIIIIIKTISRGKSYFSSRQTGLVLWKRKDIDWELQFPVGDFLVNTTTNVCVCALMTLFFTTKVNLTKNKWRNLITCAVSMHFSHLFQTHRIKLHHALRRCHHTIAASALMPPSNG